MMPIKMEFKYDGIDLSDIVVAEQVNRPIINLAAAWGEVPGRPNYLRGVELQPKPILVDVRFIEKTFNDLQEAQNKLMRVLLKGSKLCKLELWDRPFTFDLVVLDGNVDFERFEKTGKSVLTFVAPDPFAYDRVSTMVSGGAINVTGFRPVRPTISADFAVGETPRFSNNYGQVLQFNTPIETPGKITIINEKREIITDVYPNPYKELSLTSEFFELPVGKSTIVTTGTNLLVNYTERRL